MNRTEETSWWATKYARRIVVEAWEVEPGLVGFQVREAPKSSMQFDLPIFDLRARGVLKATGNGTTEVLAEVYISPLHYALHTLFMGVLWGLLSGWLILSLPTLHIALRLLFSGSILIGMVLYSFYYFDHKTARLLSVVKEALT